MHKITIPYEPLQEAIFLERPNRFLLICQLKESGIKVEAHLADPGRLKELLIPGNTVWLRPVDNPKRKTKWSAVLCTTPDGKYLVSLESTQANRLVGEALAKKAIQKLAEWDLVRSEYTYGGSRWDFLLRNGEEQEMVLEVKSVTLAENGQGFFPDAVTARGARHVHELGEITAEGKVTGALLFVAQREDIQSVAPAEHIDPKFAHALWEAKEKGVKIYAHQCEVSLEGISLGREIPVKDKSSKIDTEDLRDTSK